MTLISGARSMGIGKLTSSVSDSYHIGKSDSLTTRVRRATGPSRTMQYCVFVATRKLSCFQNPKRECGSTSSAQDRRAQCRRSAAASAPDRCAPAPDRRRRHGTNKRQRASHLKFDLRRLEERRARNRRNVAGARKPQARVEEAACWCVSKARRRRTPNAPSSCFSIVRLNWSGLSCSHLALGSLCVV